MPNIIQPPPSRYLHPAIAPWSRADETTKSITGHEHHHRIKTAYLAAYTEVGLFRFASAVGKEFSGNRAAAVERYLKNNCPELHEKIRDNPTESPTHRDKINRAIIFLSNETGNFSKAQLSRYLNIHNSEVCRVRKNSCPNGAMKALEDLLCEPSDLDYLDEAIWDIGEGIEATMELIKDFKTSEELVLANDPSAPLRKQNELEYQADLYAKRHNTQKIRKLEIS